MTLAVGQCHDDNAGLGIMLADKPAATGGGFDCLAVEIARLYCDEMLTLKDGTVVHVGIRCCLDLAAARGLRGSRGKTACLCGCRAAQKQAYQGDNNLEDLPDGNGIEVWLPRDVPLRSKCSLVQLGDRHSQLQFAAGCCARSSTRLEARGYPRLAGLGAACTVTKTCSPTGPTFIDAAKAQLHATNLEADGGDESAANEYVNTMKAHADVHVDQLLFKPPIVETGADIFI
eukprot:1552156-Pleurochrysis_carterae.AAC.1